MSVPQLSIKSPISEITEALGEARCVVVTGVTDANLRQSIKDELAPHMENPGSSKLKKSIRHNFIQAEPAAWQHWLHVHQH